MEWGPETIAQLKRLWPVHRGKVRAIAKEMGATQGQIDGKSRILGLQFPHKAGTVLAAESPSMLEARTIYRGQVREVTGTPVLKTGFDQRKLGGRIIKSRWKGLALYCLTLEERATCPKTCRQLKSCYGNNMQWAVRFEHGLDLEIQIWRDLHRLSRKHKDGFVVRLHILGDFYSVSYVDMWEAALDHFPGLRIFGYTHWRSETPIGFAINRLRNRNWARFAMRTSDAQSGPRTAVIKQASQAGDRIICPAQTGKTANCSSCGLCWQTKKPIAFLSH